MRQLAVTEIALIMGGTTEDHHSIITGAVIGGAAGVTIGLIAAVHCLALVPVVFSLTGFGIGAYAGAKIAEALQK
ncbi:MAG: hypothetical protein JSS07_09010 [Proteobacteria bacterium]|nr:hypothetical protein [Pseudomonadota bacterium]